VSGRIPAKTRTYLAILLPMVLLDRATKALAVTHLPMSVPRPVLGNALRFTLVFNRDAAMNITLGSWSRWGFAAIAVAGVFYLLRLLRLTDPGDWLRAAALGSVSAGAIGNLVDRLLSDRGVVDFIDAGIGAHRFWTFNVADVGVSVGAVVLAYVFAREGKGSQALSS
jgi:signal peptidase II